MDEIQDGDSVIFQLASDNKKLAIVKNDSILFFGKFGKVSSSQLIGKNYDLSYEIDRGNVNLVETTILDAFELEQLPDDVKNNQNVVDDSSSQRLSQLDIEKLKADSLCGNVDSQDIIKLIVQNSANFEKKTEFAKAKYIKKKAKKYSKIIRPLKATAHNLCEFFLEKSPAKIMDLRFDTLSQLLNLANVYPEHGPFLVMDETQGLLISAMLERTGGMNDILGVHDRDAHNYEIMRKMNFTSQQTRSLNTLPWSKITGEIRLDETSTSKELAPELAIERNNKRISRFEGTKRTRTMLDECNFQSLVIATLFKPLPILQTLVKYLAGSASVVIYSPNKEMLVESFAYMRESNEFVNIQLTESWVREYQIPSEGGMSGTHPHMMTSAGGGYLLSAIRVLFDKNQVLDMGFNKKKPKLE